MVSIPTLHVPQWEQFAGLVHGFLGRRGGQSSPPNASLNVSDDHGDDLETVRDIWCHLKVALGLHAVNVVTATQVHGDTILAISTGAGKRAGVGDGLMTDVPGVVLGVTAADCVPLLFLEPNRRAVAAVHAGWRGTALGIAARTVSKMQEAYRIDPAALHVAMGPSIGPCCYEVGREVAEAIDATWRKALSGAWRPNGPKGQLDLKAVNEAQLISRGVSPEHIQKVGPCTACHVKDFFSYRKEGKAGSQLSFIGWLAHAS